MTDHAQLKGYQVWLSAAVYGVMDYRMNGELAEYLYENRTERGHW
jgi:hypothetical protein